MEAFKYPEFTATHDEKRAFAAAWARAVDMPMRAAMAVYPNDLTTQLRAAAILPNDPEVIAEKDRLLADDESPLLPTRAQLAMQLWNMATDTDANGNPRIGKPEDQLKALRLFAEVRGFISKATDKPVGNTDTGASADAVLEALRRKHKA